MQPRTWGFACFGALMGFLVWGIREALALGALQSGLLLLLVCGASGGALVLTSRYPFWLAILSVGVAVRLPYMTLFPIHDDSMVYYTAASRLAAGELAFSGHIVVEFVMAVFILLLGFSGANIASFVASLTTIYVVGKTAAALFDSSETGYVAALLFALNPIHIYFSSWAYTEPIALLLFTVGLYAVAADRRGLAVCAGTLLALSRLEYLVLLLLPYVLLLHIESRSIRFSISVAPVLVFGGVIVPLLRSMMGNVRIERIDILADFSLFSVSFIRTFLADPLQILTRNVLFYSPHLLYWGVPYFETELINPLLSILIFTGLYRLVPHTRFLIALLAASFMSLIFLFLFREFFLPQQTTGSLGIVLLAAGATLIAIYVIAQARRDVSAQLLATTPYLVLLSILFIAPRYLLPIAVISSLYAGRGICELRRSIDVTVPTNSWTRVGR